MMVCGDDGAGWRLCSAGRADGTGGRAGSPTGEGEGGRARPPSEVGRGAYTRTEGPARS